MKIHCAVVFLVLSTAWLCQAKPTSVPEVSEADSPSTELVEEDAGLKELPLSDDEIEEKLTQELDTQNEVELTTHPSKISNRAQALAKRPIPYYQPYQRDQIPASAMPYYTGLAPMPYAMPYSQCPYSQPVYYPPPMYPAYPYPTYNPIQFAEQTSPNRILQVSDDTAKVENIEELLKFANWNKNLVINGTTTTKPPKRIRNWIRNKWNRKNPTIVS